ncbi:MAG: dienelactone hydrolase family protein [Acidiferrobacterales bacterium]|nr:dienelactone hydrolase family protein [Acidiferrobacterales bacterium]
MAIISKEIEYFIEDQSFTGYFAYDDQGSDKKSGVILVHEWWGHDEFVRGKAEWLASQGLAAFALDMYGTDIHAKDPGEAESLMVGTTSTPGLVEKRFMAAYEVISQQTQVDASNINAAGYCFGGEVVLEMARAGKNLNAVASFHGLLGTDNPMQADTFAGMVLTFNGIDDPLAPPEVVEEFNQEMQSAGTNFDVVNYPGVKHGFTNPASDRRSKEYDIPILKYDANADQDSHTKMVSVFLK